MFEPWMVTVNQKKLKYRFFSGYRSLATPGQVDTGMGNRLGIKDKDTPLREAAYIKVIQAVVPSYHHHLTFLPSIIPMKLINVMSMINFKNQPNMTYNPLSFHLSSQCIVILIITIFLLKLDTTCSYTFETIFNTVTNNKDILLFLTYV